MKGFFRLFKIVPYEYINEQLAVMLANEAVVREQIRTEALESINELGENPAASDVKSIMNRLNNDLDNSYAKERMLTDFTTKIKE